MSREPRVINELFGVSPRERAVLLEGVLAVEGSDVNERRAIRLAGTVQGVGFRPFVHALASRLNLHGFVTNQFGGVLIEVEGDRRALERFLDELISRPPPLARIDRISCDRTEPIGDRLFRIEASEPEAASSPVPGNGTAAAVFISPDVATCPECLAELFDPADRRYGYPFLNCTNCGPRLTIITGAPYDRERTTMSAFAMCAACRAEYDDPRDRRFHAQPTACPDCGPHLRLLDASGKPIATSDPLAAFAAMLSQGGIGAMKGLGGYHLVCDAGNGAAVRELRRRKHRDEKPFAVMVQDLRAAEAICEIGPLERELLTSPRGPIVLLRKWAISIGCDEKGTGSGRSGHVHQPDGTPSHEKIQQSNDSRAGACPLFAAPLATEHVADAVAPGNPLLGVMLPYTPLHHLLLRELDGLPLVMTSGNRSDEPIACRDDDALERLRGIADVFLVHDRPIHVRCDDSVTRVVAGQELLVRRSRGYAPQPVPLPVECPCPILAVGGQLKATFALGAGSHAFLSHHLGDLDHYDAYRAFEKDVELFQELLAIRPECIAHDLHPDYASTRYAVTRASGGREPPENAEELRELGGLTPPARLVGVQHHHAHMASCMAEHGLAGPVIGVSFDGTGFGTDGAVWGGEFLLGDYTQFRRAGHLRYVGMPGGEQAVREPWRMAAAHLRDANAGWSSLRSRVPPVALRTVGTMLERRLNTPWTSSAGRLFDAVAAIAGLRDRVSYEGQAAMELEWLTAGVAPDGPYPFDLLQEPDREHPAEPPRLVVDTRPLVRAVAADVGRVDAARVARRFHSTLAEIIAAVCRRIGQSTGVRTVVLSGGVFLNALLTCEVAAKLTGEGFDVYRHRLVPPNDGGLSLGQLAIAAHMIRQGDRSAASAQSFRV